MNTCLSSSAVSRFSCRLLSGIAAAVLLSTCALAQGVEEGFERIQFDPPREAALRVQSSATRGLLIWITREKVCVQTGTGTSRERKVEIPLKNASTIRTNDGEFQYRGGDEFKRLSEYAARLDGVTIGDAREALVTDGSALRQVYGLDSPSTISGDAVNRPPAGGFSSSGAASGSAPGGFANSGGFGGTSSATTPPAVDVSSQVPATATPLPSGYSSQVVTTTTQSASPAPPQIPSSSSPVRAFARAGEIVTCSVCRKDVAYDASYGQKCPHCGTIWVLDSGIDVNAPLPAQQSNIAQSQRPFAGDAGQMQAGQPVQGGGVEQRPDGRIQLTPPPPVNVTSVSGPAEFDLATMPVWMKAAFFLVGVGFLYYVAFYRR